MVTGSFTQKQQHKQLLIGSFIRSFTHSIHPLMSSSAAASCCLLSPSRLPQGWEDILSYTELFCCSDCSRLRSDRHRRPHSDALPEARCVVHFGTPHVSFAGQKDRRRRTRGEARRGLFVKPTEGGAPGRGRAKGSEARRGRQKEKGNAENRTRDLIITNDMLCQLSHASTIHSVA